MVRLESEPICGIACSHALYCVCLTSESAAGCEDDAELAPTRPPTQRQMSSVKAVINSSAPFVCPSKKQRRYASYPLAARPVEGTAAPRVVPSSPMPSNRTTRVGRVARGGTAEGQRSSLLPLSAKRFSRCAASRPCRNQDGLSLAHPFQRDNITSKPYGPSAQKTRAGSG